MQGERELERVSRKAGRGKGGDPNAGVGQPLRPMSCVTFHGFVRLLVTRKE